MEQKERKRKSELKYKPDKAESCKEKYYRKFSPNISLWETQLGKCLGLIQNEAYGTNSHCINEMQTEYKGRSEADTYTDRSNIFVFHNSICPTITTKEMEVNSRSHYLHAFPKGIAAESD